MALVTGARSGIGAAILPPSSRGSCRELPPHEHAPQGGYHRRRIAESVRDRVPRRVARQERKHHTRHPDHAADEPEQMDPRRRREVVCGRDWRSVTGRRIHQRRCYRLRSRPPSNARGGWLVSVRSRHARVVDSDRGRRRLAEALSPCSGERSLSLGPQAGCGVRAATRRQPQAAASCAVLAIPGVDTEGKPLWLGAATFDERVEISRTTGGITHKIGPDIDQERNKLVSDTLRAGVLDGYYWVDRFHQLPQGRNGGGDPYFTDRRLAVDVITSRR